MKNEVFVLAGMAFWLSNLIRLSAQWSALSISSLSPARGVRRSRRAVRCWVPDAVSPEPLGDVWRSHVKQHACGDAFITSLVRSDMNASAAALQQKDQVTIRDDMRAIRCHHDMLPIVILMKNTSVWCSKRGATLAEMKSTWYYRSIYEKLI